MDKYQDAKTAQRMGEVGQAAHPTKQCGVDMAMQSASLKTLRRVCSVLETTCSRWKQESPI
jgi:transposase-like protein